MRRLLPAVALLLLVAVPAARAQSLGEIAQKEAERRKAAQAAGSKEGAKKTGDKQPAKKVYTNSDLKPAPPPAATPALAAGDAAAKPADSSAAKPDQAQKSDEKGEDWWRARMANAREELRRNEMFRDALQTRINSLTNDFSARDDPYQRAQIADDRQKALAELDRVTKEIDSLKKQIADIEEEARQAGVPPGWIR